MSIRHTLFLFMLISAPVAGAANGMHDKLIRIEREMDSGKEIVTSRLDEIDRNLLKSRNDKALYSLLRTLCLDEAGVEIASDSLISTAASYYQRHGSPDHKMKTFYCRGRIEENSSNSSAAMEWYKKAEDLLEKTGNFRIGGKVCQRKAELYKGLFDYMDALVNYRNASDCFMNSGDTLSYVHNQLALAELYVLMDDIDSAARTSDALRDYWDVLDSLSIAKYHVMSIRTAIKRNDFEALRTAVETCMADFTSHRYFPQLSLALSEARLRLGEAGEALKHLRDYSESCEQQAPSAEYLELLSRVLEAEGDFKGAYEAILEHNKASGSSTIGILGSDTKFIEARHEAALREIKGREKTHRVLTTSLIILIIFILLTRYMMDAMDIVKKELSSSEEKIKNLENEHGALKSILQRPTLIDEESRTLINDRFELLDKVLLSHLSSEAKEKAGLEDGIDKLLGKKNEFISSLSKALSMTCPSFFKYLSDASLNDFEIGYCYLYILGMQKKDVESFLSKRCIDTVTKDIRRKLDLERNDVKLKTLLGEKFQELENK